MAATFALVPSGVGSFSPVKVPGALFDAIIEISSAGADYPTGGYVFGVTQLQAATGNAYSAIESVEVIQHWASAAGTVGFLAIFDRVNNKVQAYGMAAAAGVGTGLTEISANAAALTSSHKCRLRVRFT